MQGSSLVLASLDLAYPLPVICVSAGGIGDTGGTARGTGLLGYWNASGRVLGWGIDDKVLALGRGAPIVGCLARFSGGGGGGMGRQPNSTIGGPFF